MSATPSFVHATTHCRRGICALCSSLLLLSGCGPRLHDDRRGGSQDESLWSEQANSSPKMRAEYYCSADCTRPVFERDVLRDTEGLCGGAPHEVLRDLESWYLQLEQRAWSVFHDDSETHSNAERREFLTTYVEHPVPVFHYGTVRLELVDEILLAALSALVDSGSTTRDAYEHWLSRGAREGNRSDRLVRCVDALHALTDAAE